MAERTWHRSGWRPRWGGQGAAECAEQTEQVAANLCRAAAEAGTPLPAGYARRLAEEGLAAGAGLAVRRLGAGLVFQAVPAAAGQPPIVLGYADGRGQWHRDGRRFVEAPPAEAQGAGTSSGPGPNDAAASLDQRSQAAAR